MNTYDIVKYYADLLILQYFSKVKARGTIKALAGGVVMPQTSVQEVTFSSAPTAGSFVLSYDGHNTAAIDWDDSESEIQTKLRAITGLEAVVVHGEAYNVSITISFEGVPPPAEILALEASSLVDGSNPVTVTIAETDLILPLAVQAGFNLTGDNLAVGVQLDVLGKYAGVKRTGAGFSTNITLDDSDFRSLIRMAVIKNSAGSSLAEIQELIHTFFNDQMLVFDYQNMRMSYLISTSIGSQELVQLFVTEGLLPKPMAVQVSVIIYAPDIKDFFGFRTYELPAYNSKPFNTYDDYHTDWPWLSYSNAIIF